MGNHQKRVCHEPGAFVRGFQKTDHQSDNQRGQVSGNVGEDSFVPGINSGLRGRILIIADAEFAFGPTSLDPYRKISAFDKRASPEGQANAAETRVAVDGQYLIARLQFSCGWAGGVNSRDRDSLRPVIGRVPVSI